MKAERATCPNIERHNHYEVFTTANTAVIDSHLSIRDFNKNT